MKGWEREFHEKVRTFAKLKQFEELGARRARAF